MSVIDANGVITLVAVVALKGAAEDTEGASAEVGAGQRRGQPRRDRLAGVENVEGGLRANTTTRRRDDTTKILQVTRFVKLMAGTPSAWMAIAISATLTCSPVESSMGCSMRVGSSVLIWSAHRNRWN